MAALVDKRVHTPQWRAHCLFKRSFIAYLFIYEPFLFFLLDQDGCSRQGERLRGLMESTAAATTP